LILSRNKGQTIEIEGGIEIKVLKISGNQVRLGIRAPREIQVLRVGDNQIALLASQADGVDLTTKEGYEAGRQILASARTLRGGIETARKELKAFYLETGRKIDAEAKRLKQLVAEIEAPLQASKKAIDDEKARVKREAEEAKQREADAAAKAERERIEKQQREEAAKIEAARAALQAEREKLAAERAEIEAEKERQAKAEADRLQAIEDEKQAEADRLQAIEDEKRAKIEAEEAKKAKAIKKSEDLKAKAEAEAYAIECRQLKTPIASRQLLALGETVVGVLLTRNEPFGEGVHPGKVLEGIGEGMFVVEAIDGTQFEFPAYFLESVDLDCDGSPIIVLATDNGGGFEQTRDELAELNGYGDEEEGQ